MERRAKDDAKQPKAAGLVAMKHKSVRSAAHCRRWSLPLLLLVVGTGCRLGYEGFGANGDGDGGPLPDAPVDRPDARPNGTPDAGPGPGPDARPPPEPDASLPMDPDAAPPPSGWSAKNDLPYRASALASAVLSDGLHVLGGGNDWFGTIRYQHHYLYDPGTDSWSDAPADVPDSGTSGAQAHAYGDRLYLVGGFQEGARSLRVYDPAGNSWSSLQRIPVSYNYGFVSAVVGDSLYVIGGDPNPQTDAPVYEFDLVAERWSRLADIPLNRGAGALAGAAVGNRIYVLNGDNAGGGTILQIYDAQANSWSQGAGLGGHFEAAAAVAVGDEVFFFGGTVNHDVLPFTTRDVVNIYNTTTNSWSTGPTMPTARAWSTAQFFDGEFHVLGGLDGDNTPFSTHEVLRP